MQKQEYNHKNIEEKWKNKWYEDNIYEAVDFSDKPKKYILAELPYPSGKFLHIGHMMRYTVPEIYSRFLRMQGYNVMYPMGWDSFGLPAETFAIKEGITPQEAIKNASKNYRQAMQNMGYAIDWNREINTSDPKFYKWTQWMFIKLWEQGLAKIKEMPVWWCEELGVLADEEVLSDDSSPTGKKSERGGYPVSKKLKKQWVLDIPKYAERMLQDLDKVDYTDSVKQGQKNWIGKTEGINITYTLKNLNETITCFTTTPVNWGATFLVIAPEHKLVKKITSENQKTKVNEYIKKAINKTDLERIQDKKEKTGVFTGAYAINHVTNEQIPVYVADFVLNTVGTGAVQGCPAHDERDFDFAKRYKLPIVRVVESEDGKTDKIIDPEKEDFEFAKTGKGINRPMVNSDFLNGMPFEEAMQKTMDYFEKNGWGKRATTYKIREQIFSRQRYWGEPIPLIYKKDGTIEALKENQLPLELPYMKDFLPGEDGISPLEKNKEWNETIDSNKNPAKRETDTMPTWAGSNWYYIRYIDPNNDREFANMEKLKYWMPVDKYFGDSGHTTAHLIYTRFWYKFLYDQGLVPHSEPIHWRMSGGLLLGADNQKMSKSRPEYVVNPKDVLENYGADAARTYLSFIGPYDETYPWNENGIKACYRLMVNIYALREKVVKTPTNEAQEIDKKLHKTIKDVTKMYEEIKINTVVAKIMEFVNLAKKQKEISKETYLNFLKIVAPIAPFLAEDLWQDVNGYKTWKKENSVHLQDWPKFDENLTVEKTFALPIQINGKLKDAITINRDLDNKNVQDTVLNSTKIKKLIQGKKIVKFIYIKNKIVNIVVKA